MSERETYLPFESDPNHRTQETVVIDREELFATRHPEPKTPNDHLQDFLRDIAVLPDVHGVAFLKVIRDGGISIEPIITTNTGTPSGHYYFNGVLCPRVENAIRTLQVGLGLKKTYNCYASTTPDNLEVAKDAFRNEWASSTEATLLRLVLFK